jgi:ubiquinone/menaquinone biosynthesis C-methylase UbiE
MMHNEATSPTTESSAGSFYDRIANFYDVTFKFNRYERSLADYIQKYPPPLSFGSKVLDAGCGTGLLTLVLLKTLDVPVEITAVDLSASSIATAKKAVNETKAVGRRRQVNFMQANLLSLPFEDNSFDMVVTSGALEYVPLENGLREFSRVIAPGGHLLHLPIRPSFMSNILELMFRFKTHPPEEIDKNTSRYFRIIQRYTFPPLEPIGWTKSIILSQKV